MEGAGAAASSAANEIAAKRGVNRESESKRGVNDRSDRRRAAAAVAAAPMLALLHICGVVRSPPRVSRRALVLGAGAAALPTLPSFAAPLQMTAAAGDVGSAILDAWERGDSTSSMRTLIESSAASNRASASAVAATTAGWKGQWEARPSAG